MRSALLLLAAMLATTTGKAQAYLDCHFAPGWEQSGPKRTYAADNLFDYRDGAAEGYLIFGFVGMKGIDCKSGAATLAIDVSEMADADSAYGMFAANRDAGQPIAKIGMGGQVLPQSLIFAKGGYFVEIVESDGTGDQTAALQAFATKMEQLLEGRSTPPEALQWFPTESRVSVRLVPESVLGLRILKRGYVAQYKEGQAFVVMEDSPDTAAQIMKKLGERLEGATPVPIADEAFQAKAQYLGAVCIFRKGRYIGGYTNLTDLADAVIMAGTLLKRIP